MKILHAITGLFTGGAEMMLCKLLSGMKNEGVSSAVVSLIYGGPMHEKIEALGIPVNSLKMRRGLPSLSALRFLREFVRKGQFDLLQGWMYHGNLVASIASRFVENRPPVVWNVRHSLYDIKYESWLTRWVIRANAYLSRYTDVILYNSRTSARQHEAFGFAASKTYIIPNGFDARIFRPDEAAGAAVRRELAVGNNTILIGLIGRYHPMKDHRNFLQAAALLVRRLPDVRFLLAGREVDASNKALAAIVVELGLDAQVFLLGERRDIPQLNAALDIASSSSSWGEAFPNVIGEAMSCGVPCVVTEVGDSGWIVGKAGKVVPPRNPEALANAWREMIEIGPEGREALGIQARQRVIDHFSLEVVVRQYKMLYEKLITQVND